MDGRSLVLIDDEGTGYKDSRLGLAGAELTFSTDGTLQPGIPTKLIVSFPNAAKSAKKLILLQLDRTFPEGRVSIRNPAYKAGK